MSEKNKKQKHKDANVIILYNRDRRQLDKSEKIMDMCLIGALCTACVAAVIAVAVTAIWFFMEVFR